MNSRLQNANQMSPMKDNTEKELNTVQSKDIQLKKKKSKQKNIRFLKDS